jgi:hypothetical protein
MMIVPLDLRPVLVPEFEKRLAFEADLDQLSIDWLVDNLAQDSNG